MNEVEPMKYLEYLKHYLTDHPSISEWHDMAEQTVVRMSSDVGGYMLAVELHNVM